MMRADELTGRDGYIIAQALATTYALIGTLPERCREESNRHDIALLLRAMLGPDWKLKAHHLRHVLSEGEWGSGKAPLHRDAFEDVG
ncbi:hypothetical protein [Falsiroseomonas oryzae]|uniref:hypothetical protein n=1 Tax=Falsiroseomonas oryzae TaxID=2766473 RepID=UPI0022EAE0D1|nr:hypothetical protein [Roseomonas sp. MO-31]